MMGACPVQADEVARAAIVAEVITLEPVITVSSPVEIHNVEVAEVVMVAMAAVVEEVRNTHFF